MGTALVIVFTIILGSIIGMFCGLPLYGYILIWLGSCGFWALYTVLFDIFVEWRDKKIKISR